MTHNKNNETSLVPWKIYLSITIESLLAFYIATFCVVMYIAKNGLSFIIPSIILGLLYVFVIAACIRRTIQKLPISSLMLIIPLAPLIALLIVLSLIPILKLL